MTEEERLRAALEWTRARFHGLSSAFALHLRCDEHLDLEKVLEMLREGNQLAARALGYRGPEGIAEAEKKLQGDSRSTVKGATGS